MMPGTKRYSADPSLGQTRFCLDAWAKAFIQVDGGVRLCCYETLVGNIHHNSLDEVLNNDEAKSYREGLLTGNLKPMCKICGDKKIVKTETLKAAVESWYKTGKMSLH